MCHDEYSFSNGEIMAKFTKIHSMAWPLSDHGTAGGYNDIEGPFVLTHKYH